MKTSAAKRFLLRWTCILIGLYLLVVIAAMLAETKLVFIGAEHYWKTPSNPRFQEIALVSGEGNSMACLWLPNEKSPCERAVIFFNGNGGNASGCTDLAEQLQKTLDSSVLLIDYPGYGNSEGKPSEAGCYANATAGMEWLIQVQKIPAGKIVLMGLSLGGGVAVEMATKYPARALVVVSSYTSLPDAAKARFPFLPTKWLMKNRFDSITKISRVNSPVFVAHGTDDRTIPFSQGEKLFTAANEPKRFSRLEGLGHNGCLTVELLKSIGQFLNETQSAKP